MSNLGKVSNLCGLGKLGNLGKWVIWEKVGNLCKLGKLGKWVIWLKWVICVNWVIWVSG